MASGGTHRVPYTLETTDFHDVLMQKCVRSPQATRWAPRTDDQLIRQGDHLARAGADLERNDGR
eukprot:3863581-Karenia_brevis.AAC.1